jgi:imidazole glycerol-phosphate synthase subunit HisH
MKIAIVNYGAGNIQSIKFAIQRLGFEAVLSSDAEEIRGADKVIFPGVGEASSAMKMLKSTGLDEVIPTLTQPVLGICLGMQLMCEHSEEGDTTGLGIFDAKVVRFNNSQKVPQIGWNKIFDLKSPIVPGSKRK